MSAHHVIIRPDAYTDLAKAHDWYERQRTGLGAEMAQQVIETFNEVSSRPNSFPVTLKGAIRRALVKRFPYAVYFSEIGERVVVIGVVHTSQDAPRHLRGRT